MGNYQDFWMV
jgi:hypothetical protein